MSDEHDLDYFIPVYACWGTGKIFLVKQVYALPK